MKVLKELPISIYTTLRLSAKPIKRFTDQKKIIPVIVSLTSIPSRLGTLHLVIRSLMDQEVLPKKIVLWLHDDLKNSIPQKLSKLEGELFEIRFSSLTCSHRKLIHSIKAFPELPIVTCDDDLMYRRDWLSKIYAAHLKRPNKIIGNRTVHINHDENDHPIPFKKWNYPTDKTANPMAATPIGAWGVLYPPESLSAKVTNADLFLKLAPKADDLWFKAMALVNGTVSIQASNVPKEPIPIAGTQKIALKNENLGLDKNTEQWNELNEYFNLADIILGASEPELKN